MVEHSLCNPKCMGQRYRRITEKDDLLEKVGINLLSFTAHTEATELIII